MIHIWEFKEKIIEITVLENNCLIINLTSNLKEENLLKFGKKCYISLQCHKCLPVVFNKQPTEISHKDWSHSHGSSWHLSPNVG